MKIVVKPLMNAEDYKECLLVYLMTDDEVPVKCEISNYDDYESVIRRFDKIYEEETTEILNLADKSKKINEHPLILVCYINNSTINNKQEMAMIVDNVNNAIIERDANIMTFFLPTDSEQRIECINPVLATDNQKDKIDYLISEISNSFNIDDYNDYEGSAVKPFKTDNS